MTTRRISRAARDEIAKEQNEHLGCYTFDEFLDQDADFSGYLTWLEQEIQQRGIDEKYVPLACVKEEVDPATRQRIGVSRYDERDGWIDGYLDLWLDDPAKEHISILGEFGTGKTWFALHYAWKTLQRYRDAQQRGIERPRLPLVIPLRDYAKAVSVESLFSEFFFRKHEIPIPGYTAFEQLNRMGKLLLIFDGFDEMAARVDRQQMINNFWELAKVVVPGAKVILTCRTEHFPEAKEGRALLNAELQASTKDLTGETPQFEVLELEKFNDEQIQQVLSHQAQPATVEQIMGNPQLLDLARRPVLTELILEALPDIEAGKPVDMSRVYLYAVRHKMERDIKAERTFTSMADKLYFMCELSWEMLSTDRMSINYREFPDRIRRLFGSIVEEQKDLDHWHYDMMGQTMLIRNEEGDYSPAHRSLAEFFVAYKFAAELGIMAKDFVEIANTPLPAESPRTFKETPLAKAVLDLIVPMLSNGRESEKKLLDLIKSTKGASEIKTKYLGGNATKILLKINPDALENKDLSETIIFDADFTGASLQNTNLSQANLLNSTFTKALGSALSVNFSPDGRSLAVAETNGTIQLLRVQDGKFIKSFSGHNDWVSSAIFSPREEVLASSSHDSTIKLWDLNTGKCLNTLEGHSKALRSIAFTANGLILVSGSDDKTVRLWDLKQGKCLKILQGHESGVNTVAISFDDRFVASSSNDHTIRLWNIHSGDCIREFQGHSGRVRTIAFGNDSLILASGNSDGTIQIWNTETGECYRKLEGHNNSVRTIVFLKSCQFLASGSNDRTIRIWNIETGECLKVLEGYSGLVWSLAFHHKSNTLASASGYQTVKLWDVSRMECIQSWQGQSSLINSISASSKNMLIASGSEGHTVKIWSAITGNCLNTLRGHSNWIGSVAINSEHSVIVSGSGDQTVKLWNINSGNCIATLKGHNGKVSSVSISSDGKFLVSGSHDHNIKIWDAISKSCLFTLEGHDNWITSVAIFPDNKTIVSGSSDNTIKIWDSSNGNCLMTLDGHTDRVMTVAVSPNGVLLASSGDDETVRIWTASTGKCINILKNHSGKIRSVAFSSDSQLLATGNQNHLVKIWEIDTGKCIRILKGHQNRVRSVTFIPQTNILASGSYDATIKLWNFRTGECTKTLYNQPYYGMNITGIKGLTEVERASLRTLGAIEN